MVVGDFGRNITISTVSGHISSNSKCRAGQHSSINKKLVFKSSRHSTSWISLFLVNWQKLTLNQDILSVVKGNRILFIKTPFQQKIPNFTRKNKKQIALVDLELKDMLRKGAIKSTQPAQGKFLSNLFLGNKTEAIAM